MSLLFVTIFSVSECCGAEDRRWVVTVSQTLSLIVFTFSTLIVFPQKPLFKGGLCEDADLRVSFCFCYSIAAALLIYHYRITETDSRTNPQVHRISYRLCQSWLLLPLSSYPTVICFFIIINLTIFLSASALFFPHARMQIRSDNNSSNADEC